MNILKSLGLFTLLGFVSVFSLALSGVSLLASGFPAQFELSSLDGKNGFALNGIANSGERVTSAGDVNGDGFQDFYVSDSSTSPNGSFSGQVFVVFGTGQDFPAMFDLSALDGTNGFALNGVRADDRLSIVSERPGDVNGDGINDLVVAAPQADPHGSASGQTYVVFGTSQRFPAEFELTSLNGVNGFTVNGVEQFDLSGTDASIADDVNGDGIDDIIIVSFQGEAYVVFGSNQPLPSVIELASLNGVNGFTIASAFAG